MRKVLFILLALFSSISVAGEVEEVAKLAEKYQAEAEVRLWNGVRVDLINEEYAIEADWPHKWAEAVGQALYYAEMTEKKPAIILLVTNMTKEVRHCEKCLLVCRRNGIKLYIERIESK